MNVSLAQAIEIHAEALLRRHGRASAANRARERAEILGAKGDVEGRDVWTRMTGMIEASPDARKMNGDESGAAA